MSDETDATSEVARVLGVLTEHQVWIEPASMATCVCGHVLRAKGHRLWPITSNSDLWGLQTAHQAAMLAEAGLLREFPGRVDGANAGETRNNPCPCSARERGRTEHAQIATQEPAGEPVAPSGGERASRGLGERLRALGTGQTRSLRKELRAMADEVDALEAQTARDRADLEAAASMRERLEREAAKSEEKRRRQAQTIGELQLVRERLTRQVEAIRAAIVREAAHGDAITRCNLVAERFQAVLDSVSAP